MGRFRIVAACDNRYRFALIPQCEGQRRQQLLPQLAHVMSDTRQTPIPPVTAGMEFKRRIAEALSKAQVSLLCPMCKNNGFSVVDGVFVNGLQAAPGALVIGGPAIPTAVLICTRCGFVSQHALGVLGQLTRPEQVTK